MIAPTGESAYEKHAWMLILAIGIVGLAFSFIFIFSSRLEPGAPFPGVGSTTWDELSRILSAASPQVAYLVGAVFVDSGLFLLGFSLVSIGVALKSFRKGEKWAWYVSLYLPVLFGINTARVLLLTEGGSLWLMFLVLLILSLLGLVLPYRKFFPRKQREP